MKCSLPGLSPLAAVTSFIKRFIGVRVVDAHPGGIQLHRSLRAGAFPVRSLKGLCCPRSPQTASSSASALWLFMVRQQGKCLVRLPICGPGEFPGDIEAASGAVTLKLGKIFDRSRLRRRDRQPHAERPEKRKFHHGFGDPFSAIALLSAGIRPPSEKI